MSRTEPLALSIHPRNWPLIGSGQLRNTCAPSSLGRRLEKQIAGLERHLSSHPKDDAAKTRLANARHRLARS